MRIFPLVLIAFGVFGVLKHFGFIDPALLHLLWPLALIALGVVMLLRGPRWRADLHERRHERWERRMHRHYGPDWAQLSEAERQRFRAGMHQWRGFRDGSEPGAPTAPPAAPGSSVPAPPGPGESR